MRKKSGPSSTSRAGTGSWGVALAYAFPNKRVVACDRVRREALDVYLRAFGAFADAEASGRAFPEVPGLDDRDAFARNPPRPPDPDENPETKLTSEVLYTNDVVTLVSNDSFKWLGRFDNVMNSGGIKIYPEEIEKVLQDQISNRFYITSIPDKLLGQKVILIIEGKSQELELDFSEIDINKRPKNIYFIKEFCETTSGKIQRQKTLETLNLNHT